MEPVDLSLTDAVVLVTGASRGIGHDLALSFAAAGATVGAGVRSVADGDALAAEVAAAGLDVRPLVLDVTRSGSIDAAVTQVLGWRGRIDVLVNNAGLGANHDALDVTEADWDQMMDVNLKGLFFVTQRVAREMVARRYGRIVNVGSQAGLVGIRRHAVYGASKGAVHQLTRVLALEWAPYGVTVNAVAPTYVHTPGTADRLDDPDIAADILARIPVGRFATTTDVAAAVQYLASPAAGMVTGIVLPVDGGWTAQ